MNRSEKGLAGLLCTLLFFLIYVSPSRAQSTTDGAIGGTVYDSSGAVVPNAKVMVRNNGTNFEQNTTTDDTGYFRVLKLQPASYTLKVEAPGFANFEVQQLAVQVGATTEIDPHLNLSSAGATVLVTEDAAQINTTDAGFGPLVNQTAIQSLPINGGRWSDFALLTPGVVNDSNGFGLLSFRGQSTLLNNNTLDGADNNQAFFSEERGRTRAGYSSAKAAVQEFQVNTSNYSAEYGRSAGGVVNTVTKSGGNDFHGEAYFYDRDNDWGATNPYTTITTQNSSGAFVSNPYKPKDVRKMWGLGIGGPIIKDKLFFFFAYDQYKRNFPGTGIATSPGAFFAIPTVTSSTITTLATRLGVTSTQALTDYTNGLDGLLTELGPVPRTGDQIIFFPKIDWQISAKHHASFEVNRMRWNSPAGIQTQSTNNYAIHSFGNDYVKDTWGVAKLNSTLTSTLSNELRYQYGRDFEYENSQPPTTYEQNNFLTPPGYTNPLPYPPSVFITNGFTMGTPTFLERPAYPDETRQQVADTVSWVRGKHTLKFGMDFSHVHDLSENLRTQYGSYSYSSLLNYFSDLYGTDTCLSSASVPIPCYSSYSQAFGPLGFQFSTNDMAFFVEDSWRIRPRLTLDLGLRYEYEALPSPFGNLINSAIPQTGQFPSDKNNLGPRIGFAYDVFGNGKTSIRGGYGIYNGRVINSTIYSALTSTGITGAQLTYSYNSSQGGPVFPQILASQPTAGIRPAVAYFDPNFKLPQIHEIDLTIERDLGWGTTLSVSYLGSMGRSLPDFVDTNLATTRSITYNVVDASGKGPIQAATYTAPLYSSRPNANYGAMTDIFSGVSSNYNGMVVQVNHRIQQHVQFLFNYTYSHALDYGENASTFTDTNDLLVPNDIKGEYGNSIFDVRHRLVLSAVGEAPWNVHGWAGYLLNGWRLAPIYQVQSGLPYSLVTSGSAPGGASGSANGSGGRAGLTLTGRNDYRLPRTQVVDVRLSKKFTITERFNLELLGEGFNLFNHVNYTGVNNTGYFVTTSNITLPSGTVVTCSAAAPCLNYNTTSAGVPVFGTFTSANSNFAYSSRQVQIGLRLRF